MENYDIIVCGGGTSGCVVAGWLADNPHLRILLLEAGGDDRVPVITDSRVWMSNIGNQYDWGFRATSQPALNGRTPPLPMGRVLGGGSSTNGLVWARGHKVDFDYWAEVTGDPGWGYDAVVDLYKQLEDWDGPPNSRLRGSGGPVYVTRPANPVPVAHGLVCAAQAQGIPAVEDLNAEAMEQAGAAGIPNVTVRGDHQRVSMATAFIRPRMDRLNLTVLLGTTVRRLIMQGSRAIGVECVRDGQVQRFYAPEVVLSLGAINTPKVLMLSGIGNAAHLWQHGIRTVQHLPGVGQNFQDHILLAGCVFEYRRPEPPRNNSAEFTFFWKSDSALPGPDLQPVLEEKAFGSEVTGPRYNLPVDPALCWTLAPGLIQPKSRGSVELTGADPDDPVRINANFLSEEADVNALLRATELCREMGNAPELREFVRREVMPGPLDTTDMNTFIRDAAGTYFHQTCTASMGRDERSVVDGSLKVHGVQGLRIADGSVMPRITSGNTMAPCAMIGARAVRLIQSEYGM
ncbi:GMC family oxidoreductase [Komagataeibacter sp. FXV3]|uniref:GMC family oxidoreductase n=1 Tax=Komagataeibacter sp. FXV3 TaxID=2608998 RepID=UPI00187B7C05|nr:GMC family oxidoreductase N-terminal domain-containing protein [Komagataeibacter sp. FXV3]MBE7728293.1 GMC family oxidoreductase [Komagataeibacter sp. FXV3]